MVLIFPNLCLWRRSLRSNLGGIEPEKLYRATLILHVLKAIASLKTRAFFMVLVTKRKRPSYVQVTIITVKSQPA